MKKKKIDLIIEAVRKRKLLKEEGVAIANNASITNNASSGKIAGLDKDPPVDLRKGHTKKWNLFFIKMAKMLRR